MKKLFLTILFTLVLSGGASAEKLIFSCEYDSAQINKKYYSNINYIIDPNQNYFEMNFIYKGQQQIFTNQNGRIGYFRMNGTSIQYKFDGIKTLYGFDYSSNSFTDQAVKASKRKANEKIYCNRDKSLEIRNKETQKQEMMFTINDKREQCEAIGFKPETEKFADCVLRLVELDIKKQQQTQVTVAQNNGNDALVKQLQRQNNIQSSQALIDLGQQLLQPKKFNSNIYMPQTQRCTVQGFGSFSSVTCR